MRSLPPIIRPKDYYKPRESVYWMAVPPLAFGGMFLCLGKLEAMPFVAAFGCFWLVIAIGTIYANRWTRPYRVRLLPDGIRFTRWNRTVNFSEPTLLRPQELAHMGSLTLQSGSQKTQLHLAHFTKRDQAILLEHCSQFLTPEQQRKFGHEWARRYARLITAPKPPQPHDLLRTWNSTTICFVLCILVLPLIIESQRAGYPLREWWMLPQVREVYLWSLAGLVACAPCTFALLWYLESRMRKSELQDSAQHGRR